MFDRKEYMKRWRLSNRKKLNEYNRAWHARNPSKKMDYDRKYYWADVEKSRKIKKDWYLSNRELVLRNQSLKKHINSARRKEIRHELGISKTWRVPLSEKEKLLRKRHGKKVYKYLRKNAGRITAVCIQLVYEDNIKLYGKLTCYLCFAPVGFGNDSLEHKTPLSCGGTNAYENLAIACRRCNSKKGSKTYLEYITSEKYKGNHCHVA